MNRLARGLAASALLLSAASAPLAQEQTPAPAAPTASAAAPVPARAEGKAVVVVYRPGKLVGKALEPSVFVDDVEVGRMDNDRYIVLLLEPGEHRIHMTQKNKRVDVKLGAGEVAFVRIKIAMGLMKGRGEPSLADEEDAAKALKGMEPLGADKFKDKETKLAVVDRAEAEAVLRRYVP